MFNKKTFPIFLSILIILNTFIFPCSKANAQEDISPPELLGISIDKESIVPDERINITAYVTDNDGCGTDSVGIVYYTPISKRIKWVSLQDTGNGLFAGSIKLSKTDEYGLWKIWYVFLEDRLDNKNYVGNSNAEYSSNIQDLSQCNFELKESREYTSVIQSSLFSTTLSILATTTDVSVTGVTLDKTSMSIAVGSSPVTLNATVTPSDATNKDLIWSSSNTAVATVNSSGAVTPVSAGTSVITVITEDGYKTASCTVTVTSSSTTIPVAGVSLDKTTLSMNVGSTPITLNTAISPSNATNKDVTWSSSNTSVAAVSSSGSVSAVSTGTAVITATTKDGNKTASCTVTVYSSGTVLVTGVSLDKTTLSITVGDSSVTLKAAISPGNATNKDVIWSSSNTSVATVNSSGAVSAISSGTATITVTTKEGSKTATCIVTVTAPSTSKTDYTLTELTGDENKFNTILGKYTLNNIKLVVPPKYIYKIKINQNDLLRLSTFEVNVNSLVISDLKLKANSKEYSMNYLGNGLFKATIYNLPRGCELIFNGYSGTKITESVVQYLKTLDYSGISLGKTEYTLEELTSKMDILNQILENYTLDQVHIIVPSGYVKDVQISYNSIATAIVVNTLNGGNRVEFEALINGQAKIFKMTNRGNGRFEGAAAGLIQGTEIKIKVYKDDKFVEQAIKKI